MVVEEINVLGKTLKVWIPKNVEEMAKKWYPGSEKPWEFIITAITAEEVIKKGEPLYAVGIGDTLHILAKTGDTVTARYYDPQFGGVSEEGTYKDVDEFIEKTVTEREWDWNDVLIEAIVIR